MLIHSIQKHFQFYDTLQKHLQTQVYYIHSNIVAMKNIPMTLIVSITKLFTLFSIIVLILTLNNFVFQIRCKINTIKRHYKSEVTKKCKKNYFFFLSGELLLHFSLFQPIFILRHLNFYCAHTCELPKVERQIFLFDSFFQLGVLILLRSNDYCTSFTACWCGKPLVFSPKRRK